MTTILSPEKMREQAAWLRRQIGNDKALRAAELFEAAALAAERTQHMTDERIRQRVRELIAEALNSARSLGAL